jgi:hypothetical protein
MGRTKEEQEEYRRGWLHTSETWLEEIDEVLGDKEEPNGRRPNLSDREREQGAGP